MAARFWLVAVPRAASVSPSDHQCLDKSCAFPSALRLLQPAEFQAVFDCADFKVGEARILLLARRNGLSHPRLGLVIAKKKVRRSVDRNRLKRIVRESFRLHQTDLPSVDIIFMARQNLTAVSGSELQGMLAQSWKGLRCKADGPHSAGSGAEV